MSDDSFFTSPTPADMGVGLTYISRPSPGTYVTAYPDREVVIDRRERAICKALLLHALTLIEEAEARGE